MADILDLLSDNSSNQKATTGKKGFLSILKKSTLNENYDFNKPIYGNEKTVNIIFISSFKFKNSLIFFIIFYRKIFF